MKSLICPQHGSCMKYHQKKINVEIENRRSRKQTFFGWVKLKNSLWQIHRYSLLIFLSSSLYFYCINSIFWAELWWCFFCERIFGDFFELLLKLCDLNRNFAMILSQIFSIHNEMLLNFFITFFSNLIEWLLSANIEIFCYFFFC